MLYYLPKGVLGGKVANKKQNETNKIIDFFERNSKKFIIVAVILAGIGLSALIGLWWAHKNVVAIVGNQLIMKSQVERQLLINKNIARVTGETRTPTYDEAKDELITVATIFYAAADNNLSVSQEEADGYIKALADSKYEGNKEFVFQAYEQSYGYTKAEFENQIRYELAKEKVTAKLVDNVTGSYISVKSTGGTDLENYAKVPASGLEAWAKTRSEELAGQVLAGKPFDTLFLEVQDETNYPLFAHDQGSYTQITRDTNQLEADTFTSLLQTEAKQIFGPVKDGEEYTFYYLTEKNNGQYDTFKDLVGAYRSNKALIITATLNEVKSLFVKEAYACVLCNAQESRTCVLFYCKCNTCTGLCGTTHNPAKCPSGQRCSLSAAICNTPSNCNNNGCGGSGGGGGPVTPPPQPVNGRCGSTNGNNIRWDSKPNSGLCSYGSPTAVKKSGDRWTWSCRGSNGGSTSSCSANIAYRVTVDYEGCGRGTVKDTPPSWNASGHKISCDPNHIGDNCVGWYTRDSITLRQKVWKDGIGGYDFMKWTKLWSGATSSGDTVSATLVDNRKIRATFGFSTKVTVKGKGKVVDNRNPKKIVCENTVPNTTKVCRDSYSATNLKFTASTTDANYQFTGWTSDPKSLCSGTNAVCNLGNRCANLALVANFGAPPVSEPSCNVTPTTGVTPLVIKLNATNQQAGETYKFVVTGNTSPAFSKEVPQNSASPVFFTAPYVGTYTVSLVGSTGWSTNDCPAITVSSPTSGGGGEVAP